MKHKFTIEYEGMNGKREFANTDELLVNGDNIEHMIVVPKEATNGEVFMAMFPDVEVEIEGKYITLWLDEYKWLDIDYDLWNAPYKKEVEE